MLTSRLVFLLFAPLAFALRPVSDFEKSYASPLQHGETDAARIAVNVNPGSAFALMQGDNTTEHHQKASMQNKSSAARNGTGTFTYRVSSYCDQWEEVDAGSFGGSSSLLGKACQVLATRAQSESSVWSCRFVDGNYYAALADQEVGDVVSANGNTKRWFNPTCRAVALCGDMVVSFQNMGTSDKIKTVTAPGMPANALTGVDYHNLRTASAVADWCTSVVGQCQLIPSPKKIGILFEKIG